MENLSNHNIEQVVLSQILNNPDQYYNYEEDLKAEDFNFPGNREIFKAIQKVSNKKITIPIVEEEIKKTETESFEKHNISVLDYFFETINRLETTNGLQNHINIINSCTAKRKLYYLAENIKDEVAFTDDIYGLIEQTSKRVSSIDAYGDIEDFNPNDAIANTLNSMINPGEKSFVHSHFKNLDDFMVGWEAPDLVIVAGRPSMGKTSFVLKVFEENITRNIPGAFFSLEMNKEQLLTRMISSKAMVELKDIRRGKLMETDQMALQSAADKLSDKPMYIDDRSTGLSKIITKIKKLKKQHDIKYVVIDYLQLMSTKAQSREQEISKITRTLKQTARELDLVIIALSQLSRQVESRTDKRPMLSDLRESGSIEQDADMVIFPYRDSYYNIEEETPEIEEVEIIIAKGRSTGTGRVQCHFESKYANFIPDITKHNNAGYITSKAIKPNVDFSEPSNKQDDFEEAPF